MPPVSWFLAYPSQKFPSVDLPLIRGPAYRRRACGFLLSPPLSSAPVARYDSSDKMSSIGWVHDPIDLPFPQPPIVCPCKYLKPQASCPLFALFLRWDGPDVLRPLFFPVKKLTLNSDWRSPLAFRCPPPTRETQRIIRKFFRFTPFHVEVLPRGTCSAGFQT